MSYDYLKFSFLKVLLNDHGITRFNKIYVLSKMTRKLRARLVGMKRKEMN